MTGRVAPENSGIVEFDAGAIKLIAAHAHINWASGQNDPENMPSPCISVCIMHTSTGWCTGCLRTLDEIAGWAAFDDAGKHRVWGLIGQRAKAIDAAPT